MRFSVMTVPLTNSKRYTSSGTSSRASSLLHTKSVSDEFMTHGATPYSKPRSGHARVFGLLTRIVATLPSSRFRSEITFHPRSLSHLPMHFADTLDATLGILNCELW